MSESPQGGPGPFAEGYRDARVVVLGATGFIGRWVARALTSHGARLFTPVRDRRAAAEIFSTFHITAEVTSLDLVRFGELAAVISEIRPHVVFNLAGYGVDRSERHEPTAYTINAHLVRALARALVGGRDAGWDGQALVHVGSALEYGRQGGDLSEDSEPRPSTLYGRSKLAGTLQLRRVCAASGLPALTARLFTVYGPGEPSSRLLPSLLETARTGGPLDLTAGLQERDFTYVADVAEGLLRLAASAAEPGAVVNLATGILTTVREFAEIAGAVLGIPASDLRFGALPTRPEEMEHDEVDIGRLRSLVRWTPETTVRDGIRETERFLSGARLT